MSEVKEIISCELLSEVLGFEVLKLEMLNDKDKPFNSAFFIVTLEDSVAFVSIHELSDKTIDYIENKGYWIQKTHKQVYRLIYGGVEIYSINTDKRVEVPFIMGQWILKNEDK